MDKFWDKVSVKGPDACWEWGGALFANGYGAYWDSGKQHYAHRFMFQLENPWTSIKGLDIRHSCHNRSCVNPAHLSVGTRKQNMLDAVNAGRQAKGLSLPHSKLTPAAVKEAFRLYTEEGVYACEIAQRFDVARSVISKLLRRETWKHVYISKEQIEKAEQMARLNRLKKAKT